MKILITGSKGQLGSELRDLSAHHPEHEYFLADVDELDITDAIAVNNFYYSHQFNVCINCAAYTAVDKAESEKELAYKINVTGVKNLAAACQKHNAVLIHISTDFVFDGTANSPYKPEHPVNPISTNGKTKADEETPA